MEEFEGEKQRILLGFEGFSRDLLRRFGGCGGAEEQPEVTGGDSDEIELSLGLSLGGGGDDCRVKKNKLVRSSSIASLSSLPVDFPAIALVRTSSLPVEAEERRKRKEMQSLKRLEAKRRRLERKNSMKSGKEDGAANGVVGCKRGGGAGDGPGNGGRYPAIGSQGSVGSQGSTSSCGADFDCHGEQGSASSVFNGGTEAKSSSTETHAVSYPISKKLAITAPFSTPVRKLKPTTINQDDKEPWKMGVHRVNGTKNVENNMMEDMPCVATKGVGPNGRRIEGFLYKYRKGEEVSIVCVCHGSFLTPAEFVKHAGGGDVPHPLKHIVVNPSPSAFL